MPLQRSHFTVDGPVGVLTGTRPSPAQTGHIVIRSLIVLSTGCQEGYAVRRVILGDPSCEALRGGAHDSARSNRTSRVRKTAVEKSGRALRTASA
ncbi:MAG: hypothetical protein K0R61_4772 [Microvirga sp.]|nr:hypothetical protein [Microvirga sp.]